MNFFSPPDHYDRLNAEFMTACRVSPKTGADLLQQFIETRRGREPRRDDQVIFDTFLERFARTAFAMACQNTETHQIRDLRDATQAFFTETGAQPAERQAIILTARRLGLRCAVGA